MIRDCVFSQLTTYWASFFGCAADSFLTEPFQSVMHGGELTRYRGIYALFREGNVIVSLPPSDCQAIDAVLPPQPWTPAALAERFASAGFKVIGPAYIGYAEVNPGASTLARELTELDIESGRDLQAACCNEEWSHGGCDVGNQPTSGVFVNGKLVSLSGYEIWGGVIAHLYVVTHPDFRGRGFGRDAVSHLIGRALAAGLILQFRTLEVNTSAMSIAHSLGFEYFATSVAIRPGDENVEQQS